MDAALPLNASPLLPPEFVWEELSAIRRVRMIQTVIVAVKKTSWSVKRNTVVRGTPPSFVRYKGASHEQRPDRFVGLSTEDISEDELIGDGGALGG